MIQNWFKAAVSVSPIYTVLNNWKPSVCFLRKQSLRARIFVTICHTSGLGVRKKVSLTGRATGPAALERAQKFFHRLRTCHSWQEWCRESKNNAWLSLSQAQVFQLHPALTKTFPFNWYGRTCNIFPQDQRVNASYWSWELQASTSDTCSVHEQLYRKTAFQYYATDSGLISRVLFCGLSQPTCQLETKCIALFTALWNE